jgi:multiple sugar transport system substrate-binding protein
MKKENYWVHRESSKEANERGIAMIKRTNRRKVVVAGTALMAVLATLLPASIAQAEVKKLTINVNQSPWTNAYKQLTLDYTKETGIEIDFRIFPYTEMRPTLVTDIQSNNRTYDVYQYDELFTHEFANNKWVKPFNEIDRNFKVDPNVGSYGNFMYWNQAKKFSDPKGDVMSMPLNGNTNVFLYRKDIYQQLNLKVPTTWDEVLANSEKIKAANVVKYPYIIRAQSVTSGASVTYDYIHILASYGGRFFNKQGEDWLPIINSKEGKAAATTLRALAKYGPPAVNTIGQSQVIAAMQAGDAAQGQVVFAAANSMNDPVRSRVAGKIGFALMPKGCASCEPGIVSGTWAMSIPTGLSSEREQAALNYIKWVISKKAQIKFAEYGGIPTRNDVVEEAKLSADQRDYLSVYEKGLPFVTENIRQIFAAPMLAATEARLGAIAAGRTSPSAGLRSLNADLVKVVRESGYALNESRSTTIVCTKGSRQLSVTRVGTDPKCPPGYTKK